jgi:hypothetical protein
MECLWCLDSKTPSLSRRFIRRINTIRYRLNDARNARNPTIKNRKNGLRDAGAVDSAIAARGLGH